jgi:hypothetical protein
MKNMKEITVCSRRYEAKNNPFATSRLDALLCRNRTLSFTDPGRGQGAHPGNPSITSG